MPALLRLQKYMQKGKIKKQEIGKIQNTPL